MKLPVISKTAARLTLYVVGIDVSFALANLTSGMFGDGTLDWPHFRFAWAFFCLGIIGATAAVVRAFIDTTHSEAPGASQIPKGI
jgi:hypothetical protein